jgi:hypothetical protein
MKIVSLANQREHWRVAGKRKQEQKRVTTMMVAPYLASEMKSAPAWRVTFTRIGRGVLDDDNLAGSFKNVRDSVASCLGVNDGNRSRIRFRYRQRRGSPPSAEIFIEPQAAEFRKVYGVIVSNSVHVETLARPGPVLGNVAAALAETADQVSPTDIDALAMGIEEPARPRGRGRR